MATRNIIGGSDPILRKKSRPVAVFDQRLHQLLDDMKETMLEANGAGLAAVQVGVLRRACVIYTEEAVLELVNPVIAKRSQEKVGHAEGCLSFPGQSGYVERPQKVTVQAQDRHGNVFEVTGEDIVARAFCHELDHMDGIIFKDLAQYMLDEDDQE